MSMEKENSVLSLDLEKGLNLARTHMAFKKYDEAEKVYVDLCYKHMNYEPWLGLIELLDATGTEKDDERYKVYYERGLALCKNESEKELLNDKYTKIIHEYIELGSKETDDAGDMYYNQGMELFEKEQYEEAVKNFKMAIRKGCVKALSEVGYCYLEGYGVPILRELAVCYFKDAAERNDKVGQRRLGYCYYKCLGVDGDDDKAFYWTQKAADQNDIVGIHNLGVLYSGGAGVDQDSQKALELFKIAADAGYSKAILKLAELYAFGREGVEKSISQAIYWYEKEANVGNDRAQCALGLLYGNPFGDNYDLDKAIYWHDKAAQLGNKTSKNQLKILKKKK